MVIATTDDESQDIFGFEIFEVILYLLERLSH